MSAGSKGSRTAEHLLERCLRVHLDEDTCRRHLGEIEQMAFARELMFTSGPARGVRGIDVCPGNGFRFTVLPGRGMDISDLTYRGVPLHFASGTGITSPASFEEPGYGMLRSFHGGLLTTCGISNAGWPGQDEGKAFGLHGRISNAEAEDVAIDHAWVADDYRLTVRGRMREAAFRGENLRLERTVETGLRTPTIAICDTVENRGYRPEPLMVIYHINVGFPLLSPESRIIAPVARTWGYDEESDRPESVSRWPVFDQPDTAANRRLFRHELLGDEAGQTFFAVVNESLRPAGLVGLVVRYDVRTLPRLTHFRVCEAGSYICSLEPGTVSVEGRGELRRRSELPFIQPGERRALGVTVAILTEPAELDALETERAHIMEASGGQR